MNIRSKIIMITLPLIFMPLILTLVVSILYSRNGITLVATEFLQFKSRVLLNYMDSQWALLENNDLAGDEEYVSISRDAMEDFSKTLIDKDSERIFAVDRNGALVMASTLITLTESDRETLMVISGGDDLGWRDFSLEQWDLVSHISYFEPFDWFVFVSVEKQMFFNTVSLIFSRIMMIFLLSFVLATGFLLYFSKYLTSPLKKIVAVIKEIILTNDLSSKVTLLYHDEIGELGHYFNIMTDELAEANRQIKGYALKSVIARRKEMKIRNIFQKYVPKSVIDQIFSHPEKMLEGENRLLGILFSDIRSFTSFSEKIPPFEVVESLNKYFEYMVDIITDHGGIIDKFIGDAILAFFGAPVHYDNDALQSVTAGLEMIEALKDFNQWQSNYGRQDFSIGIGINYGIVTVGNIGSEKKMDYTVIGDMVNLASRLEGLTKLYKEPLIVSESVFNKINSTYPCRKIDKVIVKGKTESVNIYSVKRELSMLDRQAWENHEQGLELYYNRDFEEAKKYFNQVRTILSGDYCAEMFMERCDNYILNPPKEEWSGDTVLNRK